VWACPVSYAPEPGRDLAAQVQTEIAQLAAWAELAPPPPPTTGLEIDTLRALVARAALGDDLSHLPDDRPPVETLRLATDDLRTWYLHAAAQQPGAASSAERMTWFWRNTAAGRLFGALAARLLDHPDPTLRVFADRAIVPRDHWAAIVPEPGASDD